MDKKKELIRKASEELLQFLLEYKKDHPGFQFLTRTNKNAERLESGQWFNGTEDYISIFFNNREAGDKSNKQLGFFVGFNDEEITFCRMEIKLKGENNPLVIKLYEEIFPILKSNGLKDEGGNWYTLYYSNDILEALNTFLNRDYKIIMEKAQDNGLSKEFEITEDQFLSRYQHVEAFRAGNMAKKSTSKSLSSNPAFFMKQALNTILFGPPGTGKTFNTINKALEIINPKKYEGIKEDRAKLTTYFKELLFDPETEKGQIAFVTFHQSMSYEEFIEGIKPILDSDNTNGQVSYELASGIFKRIALAASSKESNFNEKIEWLKKETSEPDNKDPIEIDTGNTKFLVSYNGGKTFRIKPLQSARPENDYPASIENIKKVYDGAARKEVYNPTYVLGILKYLYDHGLDKSEKGKGINSKPYVLIIDEINRGNVSQIFGELITLIEEDKRQGEPEQMEVILPYSKRRFSVPNNLYIIGTMNTADRSVEALDTALRRRFSFVETPPLPEIIAEEGELKKEKGILQVGDLNINLVELMGKINRRIEKLLDKDHLIGHSYFMKVKDLDTLQDAFYRNIIPLLQEYFYGDYGKIGLILGAGFVQKLPNEKVDDLFAKFETSYGDDLNERPVYRIVDYRKPEEVIPGTPEALDFLSAVKFLINNKIEQAG